MNYYQFPQFTQPYYPQYTTPQYTQPQFAQPQDEQSYIENILRLNLGKQVSAYMNFENSQWGSKVFKGTLEAAGKDHIIISDPATGTRYLLLSIYLDYVTFEEEINYYYPYQQR
jgi:spore germination protein Q